MLLRNKPIKNVKYKTVTTHKMCRVNSIFIDNFKADLSPLVLLTFWARCLFLLGAALGIIGYSAVPSLNPLDATSTPPPYNL